MYFKGSVKRTDEVKGQAKDDENTPDPVFVAKVCNNNETERSDSVNCRQLMRYWNKRAELTRHSQQVRVDIAEAHGTNDLRPALQC